MSLVGEGHVSQVSEEAAVFPPNNVSLKTQRVLWTDLGLPVVLAPEWNERRASARTPAPELNNRALADGRNRAAPQRPPASPSYPGSVSDIPAVG
ncbi:hypothetical protein FQN60_005944 [Etheostoma spectabile]|uniref:Uncharacterized protein n=1 Tax=Etheostoma spectabile TaxID=54343 RepID=A0A5J5CII9_9PERO|nr:hypothetical protein FQN60_005944 [Etheostoma spectabile]